MNSDAAEAALGLLRLSPLNNSNVAQPLIPQKRNQTPSPLSVQPLSTGKPPPVSTAASTITTSHLTQSNSLPPSDTDAISCICGFLFDDGFSIACDVCSRWCHAACFDIVEGEVPEEWLCWNCDPRPVDRDRAVRLQKQRVAEAQAREKEREKDKDKDKDKDKGRKRDRQNSPLPRRRVSAAAIEGSGNAKKKRRASIISPSTVQPLPNNHNHTTPSQHGEDEPVNIDEPWTLSYVPITKDVVSPQVHTRLRKQAQAWRGVTAISSPPANPYRTQIQSVPPTTSRSQMHTNPLVRPPTYCLHTTEPVSSSGYIAPYTCAITPSASYLADPLNSYAHLGMPKPFVHLLGPPLDVALDARVVGDEGRFARNGCRPNAVLRPVLCSKAKDKERDRKEVGKKHAGERDGTDDDDETLTFGVFALRDLKANEEVVLGWEWDDGNAVHSLPALIESPHMFSTHHLTHLRAQMTSILHALSSTFTTCACGARARDCVLNIMAQFVDGELDAAGIGHSIQEPSGYALNGISTPANGNGVRQGQGQASVVDTCEGSSSDKENWGHARGGGGGGGVGLGIQINTSTGSPNNSSLNGSATPSAVSTPGRKVDFGPLIGTKRGFRTREKVPFGGGVGGVEMVPSTSPSGFAGPVHFGPGLSSGGRSGVWSSSLDPTEGPSGSNWRPATSSTGFSRTALSSARSGARVKTYDRKGKGRATTEVDEDVDVDVEGDTPNPHVMDVDEEKIPPRMRKRWMHSVSTSATHDRDGRASLPNGRNPTSLLSLPESRGKGPPVSSGHSPPTLASATDWRNPALLSVDSPTPLSVDSPSPDSTVNEMDVDVNGVSPDAREMPPPPMPAALDPTTISSVAFASVSPSTTFSKLSLLSPVPPDARSGSPSVFGMQVPNSARRVVLSSPPPYKSSNKSSPDLDTLGADVVINPPSPNPSPHDNSPPHRVRFASPEVLQGQPSLKSPHHALMKQAMLPPVEDKIDTEPPSTGSAVPDGQPDGASHQIESVSPRLGDVQLPETSTPVPSNSTPTSTREMTSSPSPSRDSTREPSPPVPKVKMSLKDFALRKKKQREEMAKERVRECESPIVPDAGLLEENGDEGMHVDDDGQHDGLDEGMVEEARDCDGQGCDTPAEEVARTDVREVQGMVMDDGVRTIVKDEPLAGMDRMLEDSLPNGRQRYESEPPLLSPRSPVAPTRIINGAEKANGQTANPASLKAKIEVLETAIPSTLVGTDDRISPSAPEPPPPPLYKGTDTNFPLPKTYTPPLPPCAPASHSQFSRPPQEDGEITSSSPPKSLNSFPRSYTPPTQPRSFQTSHPSPPSFPHAPSSSTSYRAPPPPRTPLSSSTSTSLNGSLRPLPSGPRALRISSRPTYAQSSSPSSRAYSGSQYIPRGPSADRDRHDRDRLDWERDRVWRPGPPRSRGRSSNSGWGR